MSSAAQKALVISKVFLDSAKRATTLVAIAALAAFGAQAQSSVTIDGVMDAGYQAINYKGNSVTGFQGNGSSTSQINFRGTSDLGGGLKANFRVESDWSTVSNAANTGAKTTPATGVDGTLNNGATFGNGELRVGLAGGFGSVDFGAINQNGLTAILLGQPFGTAIGGGYASAIRVNAAGSAVREDQSVRYNTPSFSGFAGTFLKSNKETKAVDSTAVTQASFSTSLGAYDKQGVQEIGVTYANGPLAANYNTAKFDAISIGTGRESTVNTLAAAYTMGAAKFMFLNQTNKTDTNTVNTAYTSVAATYTMGQTVLMANVGGLKSKAGTSNGKKSDIMGIGADYNLSKTAAVYARYESIDDKAGVIAAAATIDGTDTKRTRTALGLRVAF
ncbi:porin [Limnohabitans sp. TS-CS-82]|uniref:porin n=1 Tax=Limnohabitans sp. TS-CS-82 TaxID=2094193 RepID=UPI002101A9BF|nr:porin [Limnohabitans sp. TS-CS-82]